jgi:hypothetical protein
MRSFMKLLLIVGIGISTTGAGCQDNSYPQGPTGYNNPYNNQYNNNNNQYNSRPGYTTVTVTNRGQNGNSDQVVQQQVPCGSQYYDGYRQRYARC